jgi:lysophospholipase L1-like esterase
VITRRTRSGLLLALGAALLVSACSSSSTPGATSHSTGGSSPSGSAGSTATTAGSSATTAASQLYVSVGDSYAAGYQPSSPHAGSTTRNGFAYQVLTDAKPAGYDFTLANFACAGATTISVLETTGCPAKNLGPGADPYPGRTQAAAAEAYLRAHQGDVGLVTVSIGGNDVTACAADANPISCVTTAVATIKKNVTTLVAGLRAAAGPKTQIVGITYPDVLLGNLLSTNAAARSTATLSVTAFQALINPTLQAAYATAGAKFVDVTAATGGFGSLTQTTTLAPYGTIPVPVAKICTLTYYCQFHDIHPRTAGYAIIAKLIVATLAKR